MNLLEAKMRKNAHTQKKTNNNNEARPLQEEKKKGREQKVRKKRKKERKRSAKKVNELRDWLRGKSKMEGREIFVSALYCFRSYPCDSSECTMEII